VVYAAVVAAIVATAALAQTRQAEDHDSLYGGWTLNRELSSQSPDADGGVGNNEGRGRGRPGGGFPGGGFPGRGSPGGGGAFPGGGGFPGGGRGGDNAKDREQTMAVMQELMRTSAHWVITSGDRYGVTLTDAEGHSMKFVPDGKKEKHQLGGGTIETTTKWDKGQLVQDMSIVRMHLVRTFEVTPGTRQLVMTTTMKGGPDGRERPVRLVYDSDEQR
jgi:hypothetical protein